MVEYCNGKLENFFTKDELAANLPFSGQHRPSILPIVFIMKLRLRIMEVLCKKLECWQRPLFFPAAKESADGFY
jgi:hypothetical protein